MRAAIDTALDSARARHTTVTTSPGMKIDWHGVKVLPADERRERRSFAFEVEVRKTALRLYVMVNLRAEACDFRLPRSGVSHRPWRRWIDTALASPHDIVGYGQAPVIDDHVYRVGPRSAVVLVGLRRRREPITPPDGA